MRGEAKCVDLTSTLVTQAFATTTPRTLLNGTVPGNAMQNRLGRRIRMKSIHIQGVILQSQNGAAPVDDFIHWVLVYDSQPNGAAFAFSDLFQSTDNAGTSASGAYSFLNMSNSKRFKVLRHKSMKLETIGVGSDQPAQESTDFTKVTTVNEYVPLNGLVTQYNTGTAGTVADIQTGSLYLLTYGVSGAADYQYSLSYNTRLRFEDL